jgi:hypothetical protein
MCVHLLFPYIFWCSRRRVSGGRRIGGTASTDCAIGLLAFSCSRQQTGIIISASIQGLQLPSSGCSGIAASKQRMSGLAVRLIVVLTSRLHCISHTLAIPAKHSLFSWNVTCTCPILSCAKRQGFIWQRRRPSVVVLITNRDYAVSSDPTANYFTLSPFLIRATTACARCYVIFSTDMPCEYTSTWITLHFSCPSHTC